MNFRIVKKDLLLTAAVLLLGAVSLSAQGGSIAKPGDPVARPKVFVREKFDPKRDPVPDLARAIAEAGKSGKRIILDLGGEWCGWCIYMDKFFFLHPELTKLRDDNFVWVKVNVSEENENKAFLSPYPNASGYPHLYILDRSGKLLKSEDTSELEEGDGYNLDKFTAFLKKWAPSTADVSQP